MKSQHEISAMIEHYRKRQGEMEVEKRSSVDAFNDAISGIDQYFRILSQHNDGDIVGMAMLGNKLVRDAYSQIETICTVINAALSGEITLLYARGNSSTPDADSIVDARLDLEELDA